MKVDFIMFNKTVETVIEYSSPTPYFWGLLLVLVVVIILIVRLIILGPYYWKKNRIDGKVVIITGCNTGIGMETALELAKRGGKIYMACRDFNRCEAARLEIIEKSKNPNVFNRTLDLASLTSIKEFVTAFLQEESRLDILVNNAGIMALPKSYTKDGFEQHFGVNHLGHFYLTNLLLEMLKSSASSRIVVVSSLMYIFGRIRKNDLNSEKSYQKYLAYSQSKLANLLFTLKLSKMLSGTGVTVNALHPGVVYTEIGRHVLYGINKFLLTPILWFCLKTARGGAQTTIRLAIDPALEGVSGNCYYDCYFRMPLLPKARNLDTAEWLWNESEKFLLALFLYCILKSPRAGAQTSNRLANDPALEGVSGNCYSDCYILKVATFPKSEKFGNCRMAAERK